MPVTLRNGRRGGRKTRKCAPSACAHKSISIFSSCTRFVCLLSRAGGEKGACTVRMYARNVHVSMCVSMYACANALKKNQDKNGESKWLVNMVSQNG